MMRQSLGLIETVGLTAAITAADAALKSANVRLAGYELAKGGGLATVKVCGDVGAVKAAVAAATASAAAVGRVVAVTVIARPAKGLDAMTASKDTVGAGMGAGMGVGAKADAGETPDPAPEKKAGPEEPAQESAKAQGPGQDAAHPPPAEYTEHAEKTHGAAVPKPSPARKAGKKGKK